MQDFMSDCHHSFSTDSVESPRPTQGADQRLRELPTFQRNALRKIFDRPEFTPEEVVRLGYRRIQQAEGIGVKGLAVIQAWLAAHGLELAPVDTQGAPPQNKKNNQHKIEMAVKFLRSNGYLVLDALSGQERTHK